MQKIDNEKLSRHSLHLSDGLVPAMLKKDKARQKEPDKQI